MKDIDEFLLVKEPENSLAVDSAFVESVSIAPPRHLYVHVPFCRSKCAYCAFHSDVVTPDAASDYVAALERELLLTGLAGARRSTLYIGGGTPTALPPALLERLLTALAHEEPPEEWTVELNPAFTEPATLAMLRKAGVTRASVGAQTFSDGELDAMGRPYNRDRLLAALAATRHAGFFSVGLDLIAAHPGRTLKRWRAMLEEAARTAPDHISIYTLSYEPGSRLAADRDNGRVTPSTQEEELEHIECARAFLESEGWQRYEVSNYARPGHECRHNSAVWRGEDYAGLGPSACGRRGLFRRHVLPDTAAYCRALLSGTLPPANEERLSVEQDAEERLLFRLRTREGLPLPERRPVMSADRLRVLRAWQPRLNDFVALGLALNDGERIRLTHRGLDLVDALMAELP